MSQLNKLTVKENFSHPDRNQCHNPYFANPFDLYFYATQYRDRLFPRTMRGID